MLLFLPHFVSSRTYKTETISQSSYILYVSSKEIFRINFLCCSSMHDFPTQRSKPCFLTLKAVRVVKPVFYKFLSSAFPLYSLKMRHRICSSGRVPNNLFWALEHRQRIFQGALKHRQQIYQGTFKISRKTFINVNLTFLQDADLYFT